MLGSVFVIGLFKLSQSTNRNGFVRKKPIIALRQQLSIDVGDDDMYLAGSDDEFIYLGSLVSPSLIIEIQDSSIRKLEIDHGAFPKAKTSKIFIFAPYFFLADLVSFRIYRGTMVDGKLNEEIHTPGEFFTELIPVGNQSLVLRTYRNDDKVFTLSCENFFRQEILRQTSLLEKQVDGIFCTDGMISYDKISSRIVYTYFSRNQFICADSGLNLIYRGSTIDTTTHTKIQVATFPGTQGYAMASPPNIVNRRAYAFDNILYINSSLIADNEDEFLFNRVDVLDLYDLTDGRYLRSLYLERWQGKKLRHFMVNQNRVYALTESTLSVYQLDQRVNP